MSSEVSLEVRKCNFIVKECQYVFKMMSSPRGKCLIINNETFKYLSERTGSGLDLFRLKNVFSQLDFQVQVEHDKTTKKMVEILKTFASDPAHEQCDAAVVIILSHGDKGFICGYEYQADVECNHLTYDSVVEIFNNVNCPALKHKPKMFFIQACQGEKPDLGEKDNISYLMPQRKVKKVPTTSEVLLSFAAQEGYTTMRYTSCGGIYAYNLAHVLAEFSYKFDLEDMLKIVETRMRNILAQDSVMSSSWKTLGWSKRLFFNPATENAHQVEWNGYHHVPFLNITSEDASRKEGKTCFWVMGGLTAPEYLDATSNRWIVEYGLNLDGDVEPISSYEGGVVLRQGSLFGKCGPFRMARMEPWTALSPMRQFCSFALLDGKIYVMGGIFINKHFSDVHIYDINLKKWTDGPSLNEETSGKTAVVVGGKIYITPGRNDQAYLKLDVLDPSKPKSRWEMVKGGMQVARCEHATATCGTKVWIFGGRNEAGDVLAAVEYYCPSTSSWKRLETPMSTPRERLSVSLMGGRFYVTGGRSAEGRALNSVEIFNLDEKSWTYGPNLNLPRFGHGSIVLYGKMD